MPVCEICGEETETIYKCKKCGKNFCDFCGYVDEMICDDCFEE